MKIAITGANGFVGTNLIRHFQSQRHEVVALVRSHTAAEMLNHMVNTIVVDYLDAASIFGAVNGCDIIIHNAGRTKALNDKEMYDANVEPTRVIVTAINGMDCPVQLVYISSQAAAKPSYNNIPVKESDPPAPLTAYGRSKQSAEQYIRKNCNKPFTIIRPCSVYGYGDKDFLSLFKMVKKGFSFRIGRIDKLLNMIHVDELASFITICLQNEAAYKQVFFATDGAVYKQSEIMQYIALALHKKPLQLSIPIMLAKVIFHLGDAWGRIMSTPVIVNKDKMKEILADSWLADPSKAREILHWQPQANLKKNILETAKCYQELGWL